MPNEVGKPATGRLSCAAAIGAVLALPAGYLLGRHSTDSPAELRKEVISTKAGKMPNVFAPNILSDPAVRDQHEKIVESLELACAQRRLHCEEAAAARHWLDNRDNR